MIAAVAEDALIKVGNDSHPYRKVFSRFQKQPVPHPALVLEISETGSVTDKLISLRSNWRCFDRSELCHQLRFDDLYHTSYFMGELIRTFCNYNFIFSNLLFYFYTEQCNFILSSFIWPWFLLEELFIIVFDRNIQISYSWRPLRIFPYSSEQP